MNEGKWYLTCIAMPHWGKDPSFYPRILLEATMKKDAIREGIEKWKNRNNIEHFKKAEGCRFGYSLEHPAVIYEIKLESKSD